MLHKPGSVFLGLDFSLGIHGQNMTAAFVFLSSSVPLHRRHCVLPSEPGRQENVHPRTVCSALLALGLVPIVARFATGDWLSALRGCRQNNITPLWRGDRPYKECGSFYLLMLVANFVKNQFKYFPTEYMLMKENVLNRDRPNDSTT